MLPTTIDAIKSVINMDVTMSSESRRGLINIVRDFNERGSIPPTSASNPPAACIPYDEAARRLGCSKDMVRCLRRQGKLVGVSFTGKNCHGVTEQSLTDFIANNAKIHKKVA